jgi:hypothetical protein
MKKSHSIALGEYLSWYDESLTYNDIVHALYNNNETMEKITIWEPFEYSPTEFVAEQIESLVRSIESNYGKEE